MTQQQIIQYPDERLRELSSPVVEFDQSLTETVGDLRDTLYRLGGIALSAPQLGDQRQILITDLSSDQSSLEVFINPQIVATAAPGLVQESCLSIPGVVGSVVRATRVKVRALDHNNVSIERELAGMQAVCLQHEIDHFNGVLFIDRLSPLRRFRMRAGNATGEFFKGIVGSVTSRS